MRTSDQFFNPMDFTATEPCSDVVRNLDSFEDDFLDAILGEDDMEYFYLPSVIERMYA